GRVGSAPDQSLPVSRVRLAAGGGYGCAVVHFAGGDTCPVHVFDPETDQTLLLEQVALSMADVVYAGDQFHIVGITTAGTGLSQTQFDPATDETLPTLSSITAPGTLIDVSAAPFDGGYVVAPIQSGTAIHIRRAAGDG